MRPHYLGREGRTPQFKCSSGSQDIPPPDLFEEEVEEFEKRTVKTGVIRQCSHPRISRLSGWHPEPLTGLSLPPKAPAQEESERRGQNGLPLPPKDIHDGLLFPKVG